VCGCVATILPIFESMEKMKEVDREPLVDGELVFILEFSNSGLDLDKSFSF
jgi:hypothetical protein